MADLLTISTGFLGGNLFDGLEQDPDETMSCARYADLLEEAIQAAYPEATVTVRYQVNAVGAVPDTLRTLVEQDERSSRDDAELEAIAEHVDRIGGQVYERGAWLVGLPYRTAYMRHQVSGETYAVRFGAADSDEALAICGPLNHNEVRPELLDEMNYESGDDVDWFNDNREAFRPVEFAEQEG